jgi:hypothetical protein
MRTRSFLTGLVLAIGSVIGTLLYRRRAARRSERVELYFADGSMVSLAQGSADADRLLRHAHEILAAART